MSGLGHMGRVLLLASSLSARITWYFSSQLQEIDDLYKTLNTKLEAATFNKLLAGCAAPHVFPAYKVGT